MLAGWPNKRSEPGHRAPIAIHAYGRQADCVPAQGTSLPRRSFQRRQVTPSVHAHVRCTRDDDSGRRGERPACICCSIARAAELS